MVEVAVGVTGGSIPLPLLILIPKILSKGSGMLGLGDIVLPGLLIAYLFRFDYSNARKGVIAKNEERKVLLSEVLNQSYFLYSLFAYVIGMIVTFTMLAILQMGQVKTTASFFFLSTYFSFFDSLLFSILFLLHC